MVSYKYFVNKVLDKMILGEINIFNEIKQEIDMLDIHKYVIIQPMYGIKLAKEKEINIAGYKFIQKEYIKEYLKEILEIPIEVMGPSIIEEAIYEPMCYVELSFNSKDKIKVEEEARKKYKELENIISFMCGDIDKKLGYATFNFKLQQPTNYVMYDTKSEELTENIQAGDSIRIPIELDREDKWFFQQENGNYFIWELLKDKSNYNIKKRILLAIQLIGNGLNQEDTRLAFCNLLQQ